MIYVGIDVTKDKHDCCIMGIDAKKLFPVFTISNNMTGFNELYETLGRVDRGIAPSAPHRIPDVRLFRIRLFTRLIPRILSCVDTHVYFCFG